MGEKGKSKYNVFLEDRNVKRWYDNLCRGSEATGDVYLKNFGRVCFLNDTTPKKMVEMGKKGVYELLLDTVTKMEKIIRKNGEKISGGYIKCLVKSTKSWMKFNGKDIKRDIRINGLNRRPTLVNQKIPTQEDLKRILLSENLKTRVVCSIVACGGTRLQVLGNYRGNDGLRVGDFPEIDITENEVEFKKIPTRFIVREELSKTGNRYFSFLSEEACGYLKEFLEMRIRKGENLTKESSIVPPKNRGKSFITRTNISDIIRKALRKAGLNIRPIYLRKYFATQLMIAETKGLCIRDFRVFWLGHTGDIEAVYTVNNRLNEDTIEQMRECYRKSQKYLQTIETGLSEDDTRKLFKKEMLLVFGFQEDEIQNELLEMEDSEFQQIIRDKLIRNNNNRNNISVNNTNQPTRKPKQTLVEHHEIKGYLERGWIAVKELSNNSIIMEFNY